MPHYTSKKPSVPVEGPEDKVEDPVLTYLKECVAEREAEAAETPEAEATETTSKFDTENEPMD